jgi:hypothetical protein
MKSVTGRPGARKLYSLLSFRIYDATVTHLHSCTHPVYGYIIVSSSFLRSFARSSGIEVLTFRKILVSTLWSFSNSSEQVKLEDEDPKLFREGERSLRFSFQKIRISISAAVRVWNFAIYHSAMIKLTAKL